MRNTLRLAVLAVIPLYAGCGAYYAIGESVVPYQGQALHRSGEIDLGYTPRQYPNWSVALAGTAAQATDSAAFFVPTCYKTAAERQAHKAAGCHPPIFANSSALEVQHRWRAIRSVRPVASVALGSLRTSYSYRTLVPDRRIDSAQTSPFVTLRGGGEFSLVSWLHVNVLAGYREAFRNSSLDRTVSNSGFTVTSLLVLGRRYPDP